MSSLFDQIAQTANPDNHPQLRAKFEVTFSVENHFSSWSETKVFQTQTDAKQFAKLLNGLYEVVIYIAGTRQVIFEKQY